MHTAKTCKDGETGIADTPPIALRTVPEWSEGRSRPSCSDIQGLSVDNLFFAFVSLTSSCPLDVNHDHKPFKDVLSFQTQSIFGMISDADIYIYA